MPPQTIRTGSRNLRLLSLALLMLLSTSCLSLLMNTNQVSAQTDPVSAALTDIVNAFQAIHTAEQRGASNTDILPLIIILNQAEQFAENATALELKNDTNGANSAALQSINLSTNVATEAQQLAADAQATSQHRDFVAYGTAVALGIIAAFLVVVVPDTAMLVRRRRLRKARIVYEEASNAK